MLSNTKGYSRRPSTLGFHRDDLDKLSLVCRTWRRNGKCKSYTKEQELRHAIAAAKDAELLKKATALYAAQVDVMEDLAADGSEESDHVLSEALNARRGFSTDPQKKSEIIAKLLEELKQEPAYLNWSLDAAVAERMVELVIVPCPYAHRTDISAALKRSRSAAEVEEAKLAAQQRCEEQAVLKTSNTVAQAVEEDVVPSSVRAAPSSTMMGTCTSSVRSLSSDAVPSAAELNWREERHRIFLSLTPLQRCVVCLVWQREYKIEQGVVCDVRLTLEKRLTTSYEQTGCVVVDGQVVAEAATAAVDEEGASEDALEAFLDSSAFEELVEREVKRIVTRVTFRPEFGLVDLSALPQLVAYLSAHHDCGVFDAETITYFTGKAGPNVAKARPPAPPKMHKLLFVRPQAITEKELDLGGSARANELMEALEWALQVFQREAKLRSTRAPRSTTDVVHTSALFRDARVRLHGLTLTHCQITAAEDLVNALHKRQLADYLYALDLSENRLWSLRFLMVLRAHFAHRLLRLSLRSNPITRKQEYQEQVRASLPQLTSLDGEPIRRPPLQLPKPLPTSCTRWTDGDAGSCSTATAAQQDVVLDGVGRLFYIWETHRIPYTARERAYFAATHTTMPEEEELNEDNFPHRYLHPAATFSVTVSPGLNFFDATMMRDARSVEGNAAYGGMRLSSVDVRDARVFDVAMKNSSRNLLAGRPALQRFGKGAANCYLAYQFTLYPERMEVMHHLSDAVISISAVEDMSSRVPPAAAAYADPIAAAAADTKGKSQKKQQKGTKKTEKDARDASATGASTKTVASAAERFGTLARAPAPTQFVVTLHGLMSWRLPSMKKQECIQACYTRVLVFTKKVLPAQNRDWERLRSPPYVVLSDQLFLYAGPRSSEPPLQRAAVPCAIFRANTAARLSRLVVEFGLEACRDGVALVRDVLEQSTSPAAEYAALQALALGAIEAAAATVDEASGEESVLDPTLKCAQDAQQQLAPVLAAYIDAQETSVDKSVTPATMLAGRSYLVFSVLEGLQDDAAEDSSQGASIVTSPAVSGGEVTAMRRWAAKPHLLTLALVQQVTTITNACYTTL